MHMKDIWRTQRQNKEMGIVKENVRKISLLLCNIKFRGNTFAGSENVAGRQADMIKVIIGTFLQDLSLQICQMCIAP